MKEWMNNAKLFQNMTLKMASLAGAIIIWLIIMKINDPVVTRIIYDVPVNVVNTSYIESMGLSYKISDGYDTIAVTVRGNRSLVESLTASRFNVTADLTQIISLETDPVMVPLTVYCPSISSENLTASPRNINIDTVAAFLVYLSLRAVVLHSLLQLVDGIGHILGGGGAPLCLISNADTARKIQAQLNLVHGRIGKPSEKDSCGDRPDQTDETLCLVGLHGICLCLLTIE